ncbi:MAG TPA: 2-phospho-L-lactate transferase [Candidatus Limnocylindrales bacterium]|nr:2-phospho-L-lactate transferase [Candidatus Limnocylindrales bacterium]
MTRRVAVLCGGFGGARLAQGLQLALEPGALTAIVNTADDLELHGLAISPDLDTVMYTLAGQANLETGWGLRDETWSAAEMLARYGQPTWFRLGDRDLATHIVRTARLRDGARLTTVTAELAAALGVASRLLPMSDAPVRTQLRTAAGWLPFQVYFVERAQADEVLEVRFEGLAAAAPTAEVLEALAGAEAILLAPSNPYVSLGPILALPGLTDALRAAAAPVVAVSPIIGGAAVRGPADRMLASLGAEPSAAGVAHLFAQRYPGLVDGWLIDRLDAGQAAEIEALGARVAVTDTLMSGPAARRRVAEASLALAAAWTLARTE